MAVLQEFLFPSSDGVHQIAATRWLPDSGRPKAVVQLVHGISEYIGRYDHFARFLTDHGYAVLGHDHLGHGRTASGPEELGYFAAADGWRHVLRDTRTLRLMGAEEFPHLPYLIMGHSMGSFVTRTYLIDYPDTVDGAILSGTGQEPNALVTVALLVSSLLAKVKGGNSHSKLLTALSTGAYNKQFKPCRTSADWISRDPAVVDAYLADPMCRFFPTIGMFHDMMGGLRYLAQSSNLKKMDTGTPIYFFSGDKDPVGTCGKAVGKLYDDFRLMGVEDVALKLYPDGRHEMLNETNRDEVYADTLQWLDAHVSQVTTPAEAGA